MLNLCKCFLPLKPEWYSWHILLLTFSQHANPAHLLYRSPFHSPSLFYPSSSPSHSSRSRKWRSSKPTSTMMRIIMIHSRREEWRSLRWLLSSSISSTQWLSFTFITCGRSKTAEDIWWDRMVSLIGRKTLGSFIWETAIRPWKILDVHGTQPSAGDWTRVLCTDKGCSQWQQIMSRKVTVVGATFYHAP